MNMATIVINDSSYDAWDAFVSTHPDGTIYHTSSWKRILQNTFRHIEPCFTAIEENGVIVAGMPFYVVRSKILGNSIISIPFANISNPLVSTPGQFDALFDTVRKYADENRLKKIIMHSVGAEPYWQNADILSHITDKHHFIPVSEEPAKLLKRFHRGSVRQHIRKIDSSGVVLEDADDISSVDIFFSIFVQARKTKGLPPIPRQFFLSMWEELKPKNRYHVYLVKYENTYVGAGIVLTSKDMVHLDFIADCNDYRFCRTSHVIYWEAINLAYREQLSGVSLGRTSVVNQGLLDFKRKWASHETDMLTHIYPKQYTGPIQKDQSLKYKMLTAVSKHLPDSVLIELGKVVYNHIG